MAKLCGIGIFCSSLVFFGIMGLLFYYGSGACDNYFLVCNEYIPTTKTSKSTAASHYEYDTCIRTTGRGSRKVCTQYAHMNYWVGITIFDTCTYSPENQFNSQQSAVDFINQNYPVGGEVKVGIVKRSPNTCIRFDDLGQSGWAATAFMTVMVLMIVFAMIGIIVCIIEYSCCGQIKQGPNNNISNNAF